MFNRPHHQHAEILSRMDHDFLVANEIYFAGGTAVALSCDEFRQSVDIDFLCSSVEGYRNARNATFGGHVADLFKQPVIELREARADRYGIRTFVTTDPALRPIKFEIVSEGRINLGKSTETILGVPLANRIDLFAEKLLANADRYADAAFRSRDIIDLAMLAGRHGGIPAAAWSKARRAYGDTIDRAFTAALRLTQNTRYLRSCITALEIEVVPAQTIKDGLAALSLSMAHSDTSQPENPDTGK
jgi:hypothetical protein